MKYEEFKARMESVRSAAESDARDRKDSQLVLDRLRDFYVDLDWKGRAMANLVIADWSLSMDEGVRFDAMALIGEFGVTQAIPALTELINRLEKSDAVSAPYELEKVRQIAARLRQ